jgi:hypothetical protein
MTVDTNEIDHQQFHVEITQDKLIQRPFLHESIVIDSLTDGYCGIPDSCPQHNKVNYVIAAKYYQNSHASNSTTGRETDS